MNKIYQYIIAEIIYIVDLINKRKVVNFFKSKFKNNKIKAIDIALIKEKL